MRSEEIIGKHMPYLNYPVFQTNSPNRRSDAML